MGNKVRTARGRLLDFELMNTKRQIQTKPTPINVEERERFIHEKNKVRRSKKPKLGKVSDKPKSDQPASSQQQEQKTKNTKPRKTKVKK